MNLVRLILLNGWIFLLDKVVKLVDEGSVINGAYPIIFSFFLYIRKDSSLIFLCLTASNYLILEHPEFDNLF